MFSLLSIDFYDCCNERVHTKQVIMNKAQTRDFLMNDRVFFCILNLEMSLIFLKVSKEILETEYDSLL